MVSLDARCVLAAALLLVTARIQSIVDGVSMSYASLQVQAGARESAVRYRRVGGCCRAILTVC